MASLAVRLSETATTWGRAVAPQSPRGLRKLLELQTQTCASRRLLTHFTRRRRIEGRGKDFVFETNARAITEENLPRLRRLTAKEAAAYLKAKPRTLLLWARQGRVRGYRLSGTKRCVWRFKREDLDAALTASQAPGVLHSALSSAGPATGRIA